MAQHGVLAATPAGALAPAPICPPAAGADGGGDADAADGPTPAAPPAVAGGAAQGATAAGAASANAEGPAVAASGPSAAPPISSALPLAIRIGAVAFGYTHALRTDAPPRNFRPRDLVFGVPNFKSVWRVALVSVIFLVTGLVALAYAARIQDRGSTFALRALYSLLAQFPMLLTTDAVNNMAWFGHVAPGLRSCSFLVIGSVLGPAIQLLPVWQEDGIWYHCGIFLAVFLFPVGDLVNSALVAKVYDVPFEAVRYRDRFIQIASVINVLTWGHLFVHKYIFVPRAPLMAAASLPMARIAIESLWLFLVGLCYTKYMHPFIEKDDDWPTRGDPIMQMSEFMILIFSLVDSVGFALILCGAIKAPRALGPPMLSIGLALCLDFLARTRLSKYAMFKLASAVDPLRHDGEPSCLQQMAMPTMMQELNMEFKYTVAYAKYVSVAVIVVARALVLGDVSRAAFASDGPMFLVALAASLAKDIITDGMVWWATSRGFVPSWSEVHAWSERLPVLDARIKLEEGRIVYRNGHGEALGIIAATIVGLLAFAADLGGSVIVGCDAIGGDYLHITWRWATRPC